jgi:hypothetical protein
VSRERIRIRRWSGLLDRAIPVASVALLQFAQQNRDELSEV